MSLLCWVVLGLFIGIAASRIQHKSETILAGDIAVGISGAIVGGLLFNAVLRPSAAGMNPWNLSVAAIGSAGVLWIWHAFIRKRVKV